ncbi:DEAD/DEAH box helicase family protein [Kitasatospora sp. CB02891]|uniref:DEAD/DEAH box helicase family protein n=1 Tax=Kitasatospora sp. CB02891 TaxID=2020329 RepID=UPI000C276F3B|nr:DEAD/DEAH box helicase family protein [Kitasatospora sp. CB02891]PJN21149.1 hypothetical protein CG736_34990 [Kitasatospora sp. CB02891]
MRLLRRLEGEDRLAAPEEQQVLARWSGWGAVPQVFEDNPPENLADFAVELRELLDEPQWLAARHNTLNAHYTDAHLVQEVWRLVEGLGFTDGEVLEPGCGSGNFIAFAPDGARMTGIEVDPTTSAITKLLYPDAVVRREGFERTRVPEGHFDLVVGNLPFGRYEVADLVHNKGNHSVHTYFLLKSLHLVREGGLVAVLTSRHTMDGAGHKARAAREEMADLADLVGAVRLPDHAHRSAAGTEVVTDLLVFRRRPAGERGQKGHKGVKEGSRAHLEGGKIPEYPAWTQIGVVPLMFRDEESEDFAVNRYFVDNPDLVLGEWMITGREYGPQLTVVGDAELPTAFAEAVQRVREAGTEAGLRQTAGTGAVRLSRLLEPGENRPEGHLQAEPDGTFTQVRDHQVWEYRPPTTQAEELRALLRLRDTAAAVRHANVEDAQAGTESSARTLELREQLNREYDAYVAQYGPINRSTWSEQQRTDKKTGRARTVKVRKRPPMGGFHKDPQSGEVTSLEIYDPVSNTARKSTIFTKSTAKHRTPPDRVDSAADALAITLDTKARADLDEIARLLGTDVESARAQLADQRLAFEEPFTLRRTMAAAADYLSGNVRVRLRQAQEAAELEPERFAANVTALLEVQPRDLVPGEIRAQLGAVWIPPSDVQEFAREISGNEGIEVTIKAKTTWSVTGGARSGVAATQQWGTDRRTFTELLTSLLTNGSIRVVDELPDGSKIFNARATEAAKAKAAAIQSRFRSWVWEDPERAKRLAADYNERFNCLVKRSYTGSRVEVPGLSPAFKLRDHQHEAIARIKQEPSVLLAHEVGAGKTAVMIAGMMELRRTGQVSKPMVVVPNHMLLQFRDDWKRLYPDADILTASSDDLTGRKRSEFIARAAHRDVDAVIVTQTAFEAIPMGAVWQETYISREVKVMEEALEEAKADVEAAKSNGVANKHRRTVKRLETQLSNGRAALEKRIAVLSDQATLTFEQLGVDFLCVDEAHMYKNLRTLSTIPDAKIEGSGRATDLHMKLEWLRETTASGRVAVFATATPIANSITETHTMQRYLRPDRLEAAGVEVFDWWASTFGEVVNTVELKPSGAGFRAKARFAKFQNVPEMLALFHDFADVKLVEDLGLELPAKRDGKPEVVAVDSSPAQLAFIQDLERRAELVTLGRVEPSEDNMLRIVTDGRKAALDIRMVDPAGPADADNKVLAAAGRIFEIWEETKDAVYPVSADDPTEHPVPGALQLVFCDLGTPSGDDHGKGSEDSDDPDEVTDWDLLLGADREAPRWSAYETLREELVARGMPGEKIKFIHEARNDQEKEELFEAARTGRIAVLVGSTSKMGAGTNVQDRAVALHHLDAPWRPADVEQRNGRIERQGNLNPEIRILNYITMGTLDAFMWGVLERKAFFIKQIMKGDINQRVVDDIGSANPDFTELKAIASGNPYLLEMNTVGRLYQSMLDESAAHHQMQASLKDGIAHREREILRGEQVIAAARAALELRTDTVAGDDFELQVHDRTYTKYAEAGPALATAVEALGRQYMTTLRRPPRTVIGHFGGFPVVAEFGRGVFSSWGFHLTLDGVPTVSETFVPSTALTPKDGGSMVGKLRTQIENLPKIVTRAEQAVEKAEKENARARPLVGAVFAGEERLEALRSLSEVLQKTIEVFSEKVEEPPRRHVGEPVSEAEAASREQQSAAYREWCERLEEQERLLEEGRQQLAAADEPVVSPPAPETPAEPAPDRAEEPEADAAAVPDRSQKLAQAAWRTGARRFAEEQGEDPGRAREFGIWYIDQGHQRSADAPLAELYTQWLQANPPASAGEDSASAPGPEAVLSETESPAAATGAEGAAEELPASPGDGAALVVSDEFSILYSAYRELLRPEVAADGTAPDVGQVAIEGDAGALADVAVFERLVADGLLQYEATTVALTRAGRQRLNELERADRPEPAVGDRVFLPSIGRLGIIGGFDTDVRGARVASIVCDREGWPNGWDINIEPRFMITVEHAAMQPEAAAEAYRVAVLRQFPGALTDPSLRGPALEAFTAAALDVPRLAQAARAQDPNDFAVTVASWTRQWLTDRWKEVAPADRPDWVQAYFREGDPATQDRNGLYVELAGMLYPHLNTPAAEPAQSVELIAPQETAESAAGPDQSSASSPATADTPSDAPKEREAEGPPVPTPVPPRIALVPPVPAQEELFSLSEATAPAVSLSPPANPPAPGVEASVQLPGAAQVQADTDLVPIGTGASVGAAPAVAVPERPAVEWDGVGLEPTGELVNCSGYLYQLSGVRVGTPEEFWCGKRLPLELDAAASHIKGGRTVGTRAEALAWAEAEGAERRAHRDLWDRHPPLVGPLRFSSRPVITELELGYERVVQFGVEYRLFTNGKRVEAASAGSAPGDKYRFLVYGGARRAEALSNVESCAFGAVPSGALTLVGPHPRTDVQCVCCAPGSANGRGKTLKAALGLANGDQVLVCVPGHFLSTGLVPEELLIGLSAREQEAVAVRYVREGTLPQVPAPSDAVALPVEPSRVVHRPPGKAAETPLSLPDLRERDSADNPSHGGEPSAEQAGAGLELPEWMSCHLGAVICGYCGGSEPGSSVVSEHPSEAAAEHYAQLHLNWHRERGTGRVGDPDLEDRAYGLLWSTAQAEVVGQSLAEELYRVHDGYVVLKDGSRGGGRPVRGQRVSGLIQAGFLEEVPVPGADDRTLVRATTDGRTALRLWNLARPAPVSRAGELDRPPVLRDGDQHHRIAAGAVRGIYNNQSQELLFNLRKEVTDPKEETDLRKRVNGLMNYLNFRPRREGLGRPREPEQAVPALPLNDSDVRAVLLSLQQGELASLAAAIVKGDVRPWVREQRASARRVQAGSRTDDGTGAPVVYDDLQQVERGISVRVVTPDQVRGGLVTWVDLASLVFRRLPTEQAAELAALGRAYRAAAEHQAATQVLYDAVRRASVSTATAVLDSPDLRDAPRLQQRRSASSKLPEGVAAPEPTVSAQAVPDHQPRRFEPAEEEDLTMADDRDVVPDVWDRLADEADLTEPAHEAVQAGNADYNVFDDPDYEVVESAGVGETHYLRAFRRGSEEESVWANREGVSEEIMNSVSGLRPRDAYRKLTEPGAPTTVEQQRAVEENLAVDQAREDAEWVWRREVLDHEMGVEALHGALDADDITRDEYEQDLVRLQEEALRLGLPDPAPAMPVPGMVAPPKPVFTPEVPAAAAAPEEIGHEEYEQAVRSLARDLLSRVITRAQYEESLAALRPIADRLAEQEQGHAAVADLGGPGPVVPPKPDFPPDVPAPAAVPWGQAVADLEPALREAGADATRIGAVAASLRNLDQGVNIGRVLGGERLDGSVPAELKELTAAIREIERQSGWYLALPVWSQLRTVHSAAVEAWSTVSAAIGAETRLASADRRIVRVLQGVSAAACRSISSSATLMASELTRRGAGGSPVWRGLRSLSRRAEQLAAGALGRSPDPETVRARNLREAKVVAAARQERVERLAEGYSGRRAAADGSRRVAANFVAWASSKMGKALVDSNHPRVAALRTAWRSLPAADLPDGPVSGIRPYTGVARAADALVAAARASDRFERADVQALAAVASAAQSHAQALAVSGKTVPPRTVVRPARYASRMGATGGAFLVTDALLAWQGTEMGQQLKESQHPRVTALRRSWQSLPSTDLPAGPGSGVHPYHQVAEGARALVQAAQASERFDAADVLVLSAVAMAADQHCARLAVTAGVPMPNHRVHPVQQEQAQRMGVQPLVEKMGASLSA